MKKIFPEIKKIIQSSGLTNDEQQEFLSVLLRVSDIQLTVVKDILEHDIYSARLLYDNYKKKKNALASGKDLNAIFKEEVEYLDKVLKQTEN